MATSGLLLMARSPVMQRLLGAQFEARTIDKQYVAVVDGCLIAPTEEGSTWQLIDLPIAVDWPRRPLRIIDAVLGKPSQTRWRVLSVDALADTSRVALAPITGRSHQLRVHLQAIGHPILGDALYAPEAVQRKADRLLLHAQALAFEHPVTKKRLAFSNNPLF
jgi:tRNA pseudouridine32 synthase/23S rRNA pseudouridine746 synthase